MTYKKGFEDLEAVVLSGQMDDAAIASLMQDEPEFAAWMTARAKARLERHSTLGMTAEQFGRAITGLHGDAAERAKQMAADAAIETVAQMLTTFADEIEQETGRSYAPAYMREAAKRLLKARW